MKLGVDPLIMTKMEALMKHNGLQDVIVQRVRLPVGKALPTDTEKENSILPFKWTIPTLIKVVEKMGVEVPDNVTYDLQARFESEARQTGFTMTGIVIYGRKGL
jgi:hypothetical protein